MTHFTSSLLFALLFVVVSVHANVIGSKTELADLYCEYRPSFRSKSTAIHPNASLIEAAKSNVAATVYVEADDLATVFYNGKFMGQARPLSGELSHMLSFDVTLNLGDVLAINAGNTICCGRGVAVLIQQKGGPVIYRSTTDGWVGTEAYNSNGMWTEPDFYPTNWKPAINGNSEILTLSAKGAESIWADDTGRSKIKFAYLRFRIGGEDSARCACEEGEGCINNVCQSCMAIIAPGHRHDCYAGWTEKQCDDAAQNPGEGYEAYYWCGQTA